MGAACSCGLHSIKVANLSQGKLDDKYTLHHAFLGKGSFAVVQLASEKATGNQCACKIIRKWCQVPQGHPDYGQPAIDAEYRMRLGFEPAHPAVADSLAHRAFLPPRVDSQH